MKKSLKILVTRPYPFAETLAVKLKKEGFIPELLPVIEFKETAKVSAKTNMNEVVREDANQIFSKTDIAIFVSRASVQYGMKTILDGFSEPPNILYAAIGPATADALKSYELKNIIFPSISPYESESLLKHPALQSVHNKNIVIFRGNGGRNLLELELTRRGAKVKIIECYERRIPSYNIAGQLKSWQQDPIDVTLVTSAQILENLRMFVGPINWNLLLNQPMVVVGLRTQALAATLGVTQTIVAKDADDASLMEALINFRNHMQ